MLDVAVIVDPAAAEVALDPVRARLLAELAEPGSATTLAARVGLPRQKVNYHLRTLERHGLIQLVEERKKGNVTERFLRAAAIAFVISPLALAAVQPDPARSPDRLSARWLLALAARLVRDVGELISGAQQARLRVAAFAEELSTAVQALLAKYHDATAQGGRDHRLIVAIHPSVTLDSVHTDIEKSRE